jgi:hypothetical protein
MHVVERDRQRVIFEALAERVRQPLKTLRTMTPLQKIAMPMISLRKPSPLGVTIGTDDDPGWG